MENKSSIGSLVAVVVSAIALACSVYAMVHSSPAHAPTKFGSFIQGEVYYNPFIFVNGFAAGSSQQFSVDSSGNVSTTGTFKLGSNGTAVSNSVMTTCSIISDASIAATSTGYGYCKNVTGVTSADLVDSNFATSSTLMQDQWIIAGAKASTTAGSIDFRILNLSGKAQAFSAATTIGSSTIIQAGH